MKSFLQLLSRVGMLNLMISLFMMPLYIPINSSNSKNKVQRKIPNVKRMRSYPAVLIGRIGVSTAFQNKGYDIGKQTINYIKRWFIHPDNKTGCRFVVVVLIMPQNLSVFTKRMISSIFMLQSMKKKQLLIFLNQKSCIRE